MKITVVGTGCVGLMPGACLANVGNDVTCVAMSYRPLSMSSYADEGRVESHAFVSHDEFIQTFELAAPGRPFQTYSRNRFKRVAR